MKRNNMIAYCRKSEGALKVRRKGPMILQTRKGARTGCVKKPFLGKKLPACGEKSILQNVRLTLPQGYRMMSSLTILLIVHSTKCNLNRNMPSLPTQPHLQVLPVTQAG